MPRSTVAFTHDPIDVDTLARAVSAVLTPGELAVTPVEIRPLDGGAAVQVLMLDRVVLTVLRPRRAPAPSERARVYGVHDVDDAARWSCECLTPWKPEGSIGLQLIEAAVTDRTGYVIHQQ